MATLVLTGSGGSTSGNFRLRMTYTESGSGITITKIEGCRTDGYQSWDLDTPGIGYLNGAEMWRGLNFPANSSYYTMWTGSKSAGYSGTFTLGNTDVSSLYNTKFSYSITPSTRTLTLNRGTGVASFTGGGSYAYGATASTTATASTGYNLAYYSGTTADGSSTSTWTGCAGLSTHSDTWTMNANRTITVYATPWTHTVAYNANGGSGAPSSQTKTYGATLTLSSTKPTRTGYTFLGWSTSSTATSATYAAGGVYGADQNGGTVTLYAVWSANQYTLTVNPNGGTWNGSSSASALTPKLIYNSGNWNNIGSSGARTGHTLKGYYTAASGGTKVYNADGTCTNEGTYWTSNRYVYANNLTVYAQWTVNNYYLDLNGWLDGASSGGIAGYGTVDVYINGSSVGDNVGDYYTAWPYGTTYEIKDIKATTGHRYNGVYSGSLSGTISSNTTVVLNFATNKYTITYDANGGTGAPAAQTYTYAATGTTNLSSTVPTRAGYTFLGWSTSSTATSPTYSPGQAWNLNNTSDYILYAVWRADSVKYKENGTWVDGLVYIKENGTWVRGKMYTKVDGNWVSN